MGWFGFNGGSCLESLVDIASANSVAMVFLNTNAAQQAAQSGALILAVSLFGKADLTDASKRRIWLVWLLSTAGPDTPFCSWSNR